MVPGREKASRRVAVPADIRLGPRVPDTRLIERWPPIAALGIESTRERTPMTPFPASNRRLVRIQIPGAGAGRTTGERIS